MEKMFKFSHWHENSQNLKVENIDSIRRGETDNKQKILILRKIVFKT